MSGQKTNTCCVKNVVRVGARESLLDAWGKTQTTQTQPSAAATSRFRSLTLTNCCRSRFVVAKIKYKREKKSNAQSRLREQLAVRLERRVAATEGSGCVVCVYSSCVHSNSQTPNNSISGQNRNHSKRKLQVKKKIMQRESLLLPQDRLHRV